MWPMGEQRAIAAINQKIDRGHDYAQGKILVAFFDYSKSIDVPSSDL